MAREFLVIVNHYYCRVEETKIGTPHWVATIDGEKWSYRIEKEAGFQRVHNWFERGTIEVQYHARNTSKTGIALWKRAPKQEPKESAKKKLIQSKMRKLL